MVVKNFLLLFVILFLSSGLAESKFVPDISLIREWNKEFYERHSYQPFPKIIRFAVSKGRKTLTYVATKHKDWKSSQLKIKMAIEQDKPEIILIEGIQKSQGLSPRVWNDKIKQSLNVEGFEGYYAYKLAIENRIPFVGAELEGKMSEHSSYKRDVAVVVYLFELLNQYDRILVVYGAGHYVQQEIALTKIFGAPDSVQ